MSTYNPFGGKTYNLGSSISSTATTILLSSFLEPVSNVPYTMVLLNTDIAYGTIAPKTTSSEFISFTGITQNANGTATLTGVTRGLAKKYPFTTDATFKLPHSGQSIFIISDAPQVFKKYVSLENAETVTGIKTFATGATPLITDQATTNLMAANKLYVDTAGAGKQAAIQFQDEGSNLGSAGTVDTFDVTGTGLELTRASNKVTLNVTGIPGAGTVTSVGTGTGLTGGPITATGTIVLADTTVVPGSYTSTNLTVDAQGRITAATSGSVGDFVVGALPATTVKTYFNMQLPFILWTGAVVNDTTTTFANWVRTSTDTSVTPGGAMAQMISTGSESIRADNFLLAGIGQELSFDDTNIVVLDFWAKFSASTSTGDVNMGFGYVVAGGFESVYNTSTYDKVMFTRRGSTGLMYATIAKATVGVTNTDISAGLVTTDWNNYRIELDLSNNALFYINGVLKATLSGANLPNTNSAIAVGFGRDTDASFAVTAPTVALEMNP